MIGNGLAGLVQLLVAVGAAVAAAAVSGSLPEVPAGGALTVAAVIGAFVLGFAFYAVGYAILRPGARVLLRQALRAKERPAS